MSGLARAADPNLCSTERCRATKNNQIVKQLLTFAAALFLSAQFNTASAAEFPSKQGRIIVPFAAGGTADVLARVLAEKMRPRFPQGMIVENRTGAGGNIGADAVFNSEADGHTVLLSSPVSAPIES